MGAQYIPYISEYLCTDAPIYTVTITQKNTGKKLTKKNPIAARFLLIKLEVIISPIKITARRSFAATRRRFCWRSKTTLIFSLF